jgi:hypothetical protein
MVYVPPVDSVMFPSDGVEKHLNGQHDQSTHAHGGAGGKATSSTVPKEAMKVPEHGLVSKDNEISATFPYVGLTDKAQGIAASISDVNITHNNPASQWGSLNGEPETVVTATYTDRDGTEHYLKMYEGPSADGTGVHAHVMAFDTKENLEASFSTDSNMITYSKGYQGHIQYGANFRNPIIAGNGQNSSMIYKAVSKGKGVATALLELARSTSPAPIFHSTLLSEDGAEFAATTKSFEKHLTGKHDQSSHSGGGAGKAPKTAVGEKLTASVLENVKANGGLSVRLTNGSQPTSGYMVSRKGFGAIHPAKDFFNPEKGKQILSDYLKKNKQFLSTGKDYLGLWHNKKNGNVYLDVSMKIGDRQSAINSGVKNDQISIWDVVNFEEIETGGTGNV